MLRLLHVASLHRRSILITACTFLLFDSIVAIEDLTNTTETFCFNSSEQSQAEAQEEKLLELIFPAEYHAIIRYTDVLNGRTAKIDEYRFNHSHYVQREESGIEEIYVMRNTSSDELLYHREKMCSHVHVADLHSVYNLSQQVRDLLNINGSSLVEIVKSLNTFQGHYVKSHWIDGVNTVPWVACVNETKLRPAFEMQVNFLGVGKDSLPSYANLTRPLVASVRLIAYSTNNSTNAVEILSHVWLTVVVLEPATKTQRVELMKPRRGVFCSGMEMTRLPTTLPLKFEAEIEYSDDKQTHKDTAKLMYDGENRIIAFALDFDADSDIPFVQNINETTMKLGRAFIVQDFNYGYEYVLSRDGRSCTRVQPIQSTWADVETVDGGLLSIRNPTEAFFNITHDFVYHAGQVDDYGSPVDLFVSHKTDNATKSMTVVELLVATAADGSRVISSIVQYHKTATQDTLQTTNIRFNSLTNNTLLGTPWSRYSVFPCLNEQNIDNFFYVKVEKPLDELKNFGYESVESALTEAIAKTTNVSVLRVSHFLLKPVAKQQVYACFLLGSLNNLAPAKTRYLRKEKSVVEVHDLLNQTLQEHTLEVTIVNEQMKTSKLVLSEFGVVAMSDGRPKPPPEPKFRGYSSGSMFILGCFSWLFGASAAVAGYVFYTRRQHVRTIAYQVFE